MREVVELLRRDELFPRYDGLIARKEQDGFVLLNYTQECMFSNAWDAVTLACRGLILDARQDYTVAALPFPKFFNIGERPEVALERLPQAPFSIYEKVDGSLGIMYRDRSGTPRFATRGSFTSEQSVRGTEMLRALPGIRELPDELTFCFEIVYNNQHCSADTRFSVVRYDFEGLVLLAIFNRFTGEELPWPEVAAWGERLGVRTPEVYSFGSLDEAVSEAKTLPVNMEGFVIRFANGLRVKLKGDAYLQLNRILFGATGKRILEALHENTYRALLLQVPEEFRSEIEAVAEPFITRADELKQTAGRLYEEAPKSTRKDFALWVQQHVPEELRGALFQFYTGRVPDWYKLLMK